MPLFSVASHRCFHSKYEGACRAVVRTYVPILFLNVLNLCGKVFQIMPSRADSLNQQSSAYPVVRKKGHVGTNRGSAEVHSSGSTGHQDFTTQVNAMIYLKGLTVVPRQGFKGLPKASCTSGPSTYCSSLQQTKTVRYHSGFVRGLWVMM